MPQMYGLRVMLGILGLLGAAFLGMAFVSPGPSQQPEDGDGSEDGEGQPGSAPAGAQSQGALPDLLEETGPLVSPAMIGQGSDGDDSLSGRSGNDWLDAIGGDDQLSGGTGDDRLDGGPGDDTIYGGAGNDDLSGSIGDDSLSGGAGDDRINGGGGRDEIYGGTGDDALHGLLDDDLLIGGSGQDVLHGGLGADILDGVSGEGAPYFDYLNGGAGNDVLLGGAFDNMNGGTGEDIFVVQAGADGPAILEDFDGTQDTLAVLYDRSGPAPILSMTIEGDGLTLLADDQPVAILPGQTSLDLKTVKLIAT